ncbi:MAG: hypothetical protein L0J73_13615, partial [Halomonas sp.]|nr:hypothetical protein [Halomonas sp.]
DGLTGHKTSLSSRNARMSAAQTVDENMPSPLKVRFDALVPSWAWSTPTITGRSYAGSLPVDYLFIKNRFLIYFFGF